MAEYSYEITIAFRTTAPLSVPEKQQIISHLLLSRAPILIGSITLRRVRSVKFLGVAIALGWKLS